MRTRLHLDADRRATTLRRSLAAEFRRMREDAGLTRAALARAAGVHPSAITKLEDEQMHPTIEMYSRVATALGADFVGRVYPTTGPRLHDRHQVRMAELLLSVLHPRWHPLPEVAVRRPARGWVDLALHDPVASVVVASELESGLRRVEQLLRWSEDKAASLPSAAAWAEWSAHGPPAVSRLLVVRWTRANREAARDARRQLRAAYPCDPGDAVDALTGTTAWPGPSLVWARMDGPVARLEAAP